MAVAGIIGADLGWVIIFGLICGIPAFLVGGVLFGRWIGGRMPVDVPKYMIDEVEEEQDDPEEAPPFGLIVGLILLPLVLILSNTLATAALPEDSPLRTFLTFIGDPVTALLLALLLTSTCWASGAGGPANASSRLRPQHSSRSG